MPVVSGVFVKKSDHAGKRPGNAPWHAWLESPGSAYYPTNMKTISITIDPGLLQAVDRLAVASRKTRSDVCRRALRAWLAASRREELVRRDREGYRRKPVKPDEFAPLIAEQPWLKEDGSGTE